MEIYGSFWCVWQKLEGLGGILGRIGQRQTFTAQCFCPQLPVALGRPPWATVGPLHFCDPKQSSEGHLPQQAEPQKLWGSGETKREGNGSADRAIGHRLQDYKEGVHRRCGTTWRPRLCSGSWVSKAVVVPFAFPFFLPRDKCTRRTVVSCLEVRAFEGRESGWL